MITETAIFVGLCKNHGAKPEDALHVVSVTKSVASALIGIAIDEKIISELDATLPELFPRYGKYLTADEKSMYARGWTLRQIGAELGVPWKSVGE